MDLWRYVSNINTNWLELFTSDDILKKELHNIENVLLELTYNNIDIIPKSEKIFNCFSKRNIEDTKVIICGQDPYPDISLATGYCFSVPSNKTIPPSLRNILKEVLRTEDGDVDENTIAGNLEHWADQGILMLNLSLTVENGKPKSHSKIWKNFTCRIVNLLSEKMKELEKPVVFMLWGNEAKSLMNVIDVNYHDILTWTHPSPLSRKPFIGCNHFTDCNELLLNRNSSKIKW